MKSTKILEALKRITDILNQDPMSLYKMIGPKSIQLEITNLCNLRCVMCDRWKWDKEKLQGTLSTENLFSLFDNLAEQGTQHILISGGEPLLRKDFTDIVQYIHQKGIKLTVITNGVFLTKEIALPLIESDSTIILSVDGSNEEIYSRIRGRKGLFLKIIENIKNLVALKKVHSKGFISMHFVIQKQNLHDIFSYFDLSKSLGVDTVSYGIVHGPHIPETGVGFNQENIKPLKEAITTLISLQKKETKIQIELRADLFAILADEIPLTTLENGLLVRDLFKKNPVPCLSLNYWALIDAFGDVYPCCYAYFDNLDYESVKALRNRLCFGNIHDATFEQIWSGDKFNSFRKAMNPVKIDIYPEVCGNCGSYFFFKEKWDGITRLKQSLENLYEKIELDLTSIRDMILECFAKPIDRAPRPYESEIEKMVRSIFDF